MNLRKCHNCGVEFDRNGTRALYCSTECCARYHEMKRSGTPKRRRQNRESQRRWRERQKERQA